MSGLTYNCGNEVKTGDRVRRLRHHTAVHHVHGGHTRGATGVVTEVGANAMVVLDARPEGEATYMNLEAWELVSRDGVVSPREVRTLELADAVRRATQAWAIQHRGLVELEERRAAAQQALIEHLAAN